MVVADRSPSQKSWGGITYVWCPRCSAMAPDEEVEGT